jgi:hypothetical protein
MALFPAMQWGWLNGWLLLSLLFLVFGVLLSCFSRDIVTKLYDISWWRRYQTVVALLGKLAVSGCFVLIIGTRRACSSSASRCVSPASSSCLPLC